MEKPDLHELLFGFIHNLEALRAAFPLSMGIAYGALKAAAESHRKFLEEHGKLEEETEDIKKYKLPLECSRRASKLRRRHKRMKTAIELLPKKHLVSFVSEYDAFLGRMIKAVFYMKPDILNSSDKKMSFGDLARLPDLEAAREFIIEKEVETVLRKSHSDQFSWLEKNLNIPLRKNLDSWATFVELTERRNLFVHCNGEISNQYITVCKQHDVCFDSPPIVGDKLGAEHKYLEKSFQCLYEIGVKLVNVIWRKLSKDELDRADGSLNNFTYDLLSDEEYEIAKRLLDFATETLPKCASEINRRMFVINRAQTYKWLGDEDIAQRILDAEDWSACGDDFQLCVAVLRDDFDAAAKRMADMGANGRITEQYYQQWPVFRKFRESELFKETFEEVFGHPPTNIEEIEKANAVNEQQEVEGDTIH